LLNKPRREESAVATNTEQAPNLVVDSERSKPERLREVVVIGHANLFYWWPVWVVGYAFALLIGFQHVNKEFAPGQEVWFPTSQSLGVIYCVTIGLVLVMTNVTLRGLSSGILVVSLLAVTLFFAYMDWWPHILRWFGELTLFMNMGFYLFLSTIILVCWAMAFFVFDRLDYWIFRPGQAVNIKVFGGGEHTYDTRGMSVNKLRNDLFRHWILGIGSGDLHIAATGAVQENVMVHNVLFVGSKINRIADVIALKPDEVRDLYTVGKPS
jgi:hypothetical protein